MKKKKKGFLQEFKAFISRGSVVDMAVGVVVGSAFSKIVTSLVNDMIMPLVGLITKEGFAGLYFTVGKTTGIAAETYTTSNGVVVQAGDSIYPAYFTYGNVIQAVINFLLIALVIFIIIKAINKFHEKTEKIKETLASKEAEEEVVTEQKPAPIPEDIVLLTEIRDILAKQDKK